MSRFAALIAASTLVIALVAIHDGARTDLGRPAEGFDGVRAFNDLEQLVALGPRPPGSPALERAREYIAAQLGTAGVELQRDPFTATTPVGRILMVNMVGVLWGASSNVVIIAGHYDTARLKGIAFVGANDGGSSAAELLELARVLSKRRHFLTYWLVFFDGEEALEQWSQTDSLYGSRHLAEELATDGRLAEVRALILVDMVAGQELHILEESNSTQWLREMVLKKARQLGYARSFGGGQFPVEDDHLPFVEKGVATVDIIDLTPFKTYHHTAQDTADKCSPASLAIVGRVVLATLGDLEGQFGMDRTGMETSTGSRRSTLKYLAKSLVVLLIVTCAWRYGRELVHAWLAHATRATLAPAASPPRLPSGEHYSPGEDLERLDYQAIGSARQSLDIAMYSFTDILLAAAVREAGRRGVQVRIYRDGDEYEREQAQVRRHRSAMQALRGEANIRIRVKPPGRDYMHLKVACIDGRLLRTGSANWSPSGEKREDDDADYSTDPNAIERFERDFEALWNRSDNIVVQ